jgi:hypothetical protein
MAAGNIGFDADKLRTFACPTDAMSGMTQSGGCHVSARKQPVVTLSNAGAREFAPYPVWPRGGVTSCGPQRFDVRTNRELAFPFQAQAGNFMIRTSAGHLVFDGGRSPTHRVRKTRCGRPMRRASGGPDGINRSDPIFDPTWTREFCE